MAKGGIIMDVTTPQEARIAEEAGVMSWDYEHLKGLKKNQMLPGNGLNDYSLRADSMGTIHGISWLLYMK